MLTIVNAFILWLVSSHPFVVLQKRLQYSLLFYSILTALHQQSGLTAEGILYVFQTRTFNAVFARLVRPQNQRESFAWLSVGSPRKAAKVSSLQIRFPAPEKPPDAAENRTLWVDRHKEEQSPFFNCYRGAGVACEFEGRLQIKGQSQRGLERTRQTACELLKLRVWETLWVKTRQ